MNRGQELFQCLRSRKIILFVLAFFSILGSVLGVFTAHSTSTYYFYLMRTAVTCHVSIVGLFFVMLLPFVITAFAVWISMPLLLLPVSFFSSFSFSLIVCYVVSAFGSAGWLVCSMFLFTSASTQLCLYWLSIRHLHGSSNLVTVDFLVCIVFLLAISMIDYLFVAPFLVQLINF